MLYQTERNRYISIESTLGSIHRIVSSILSCNVISLKVMAQVTHMRDFLICDDIMCVTYLDSLISILHIIISILVPFSKYWLFFWHLVSQSLTLASLSHHLGSPSHILELMHGHAMLRIKMSRTNDLFN